MLSKTHTKYIQSLQHKKFRDEMNLFVAEGPKVVLDLLKSRQLVCKEILALQSWLMDNSKIIAQQQGVAIEAVEEFELQKLSGMATANQVLAVFEKRNCESSIEIAGKLTLALDTIQDPGNLGTIIRIADWFGIQHIICSTDCADMYNPKVVQSTMGSLVRVNIVYTNLYSWLKEIKNIKIYAATLGGKNIKTIEKPTEGIFIIGNEANGISESILELADEKITIPKIGTAESLNAAVATGIIMSVMT